MKSILSTISVLLLLAVIDLVLAVYMPTELIDYEKDMWPSEEAEEKMMQLLTADEPIPATVDWRQVGGRVSSVRSQGRCDSCWAFSIAGLLEGQQVILKNDTSAGNYSIVELSVQNLIDCNPGVEKRQWYNSCQGGKFSKAMADIRRIGGIMAEKDYPYEALDGTECKFNKSLAVMSKPKSFAIIENGSEFDLQKLVARYGPVSVRMDAGGDSFDDYKSGVYYDPKSFWCTCSNCNRSTRRYRLAHYMLVVGYGSDEQEGDYWLLKNSWGKEWGENGYMRLARNRNNNCKIAGEFYAVFF